METCQGFSTVDGSMTDWTDSGVSAQARCDFLESGGILFFKKSPFAALSPEDSDFLLGQRQAGGRHFKNIAYRPLSGKLTGIKAVSPAEQIRLKNIMQAYSENASAFLRGCLSPYREHLSLDYASFRPIEEKDRESRLRADNRLLHVDSFPTRPTSGNRILRFFTNIHPTENRVWRTSDCFDQLAWRYHGELAPYSPGVSHGRLRMLFQQLGLVRAARPPYDQWMLNFHHFLKGNPVFQAESRKDTWEFPPGSSWIVYTDMVSHSVLSGKYALEQTFIVDHAGMVRPEKSPLRTLEAIFQPG